MGLCCDISPANLVLRLPKWAQFANEKQFAFMSVISVKNKHIYSVFIKLNLSILSWKQTREITTYLSKLQLFTFLWHTCWQKLSAWLCIMAQCCHAILRDMDLKIDKVIRVWKWSVLGAPADTELPSPFSVTVSCMLSQPLIVESSCFRVVGCTRQCRRLTPPSASAAETVGTITGNVKPAPMVRAFSRSPSFIGCVRQTEVESVSEQCR